MSICVYVHVFALHRETCIKYRHIVTGLTKILSPLLSLFIIELIIKIKRHLNNMIKCANYNIVIVRGDINFVRYHTVLTFKLPNIQSTFPFQTHMNKYVRKRTDSPDKYV